MYMNESAKNVTGMGYSYMIYINRRLRYGHNLFE